MVCRWKCSIEKVIQMMLILHIFTLNMSRPHHLFLPPKLPLPGASGLWEGQQGPSIAGGRNPGNPGCVSVSFLITSAWSPLPSAFTSPALRWLPSRTCSRNCCSYIRACLPPVLAMQQPHWSCRVQAASFLPLNTSTTRPSNFLIISNKKQF